IRRTGRSRAFGRSSTGDPMLLDILNYSIDGLRRRSLRSWLTIIGIVIGVMSIVLLVALGQGIDVAVRSQLSFFGDDVMQIDPGSANSLFAASGTLTENDWHAVERVPGVEIATPVIGGSSTVQFKDETAVSMVGGLKPDYVKVYSAFEIGEGRLSREGESGVAVVGYKFANDFWGTKKDRQKVRLGSRIIVENRSFSVIGIMKPAGGLLSTADLGVFVPYEESRDLFPSSRGNKRVEEIAVKLSKGANPKTVEADITRVLDNIHKIKSEDERDYKIITSEQIMSSVGNITGLLTGFLLLVAAISLVVGSINVANTMFMSVLERTREIGILKAVGADESVIRNIFVIESGLIGALGGLIGVILSYVIAGILEAIASFANVPLPLRITWQLVLFAMGVSFVVGMIAGYVPAKRAAKLGTVDALRYE
ncbi:MAG: ABC transporter permease, partial [Candidatus Micrarchaeota archaeon]